MKILVVGAGMYVTGRENSGVGTILSSLCEASKKLPIDLVTVVARSKKNKDVVLSIVKRINSIIGSSLNVDYYSLGDQKYQKLDELNNLNKYDASIISIPDHLHYEYTKFMIERKIHTLVVKPYTLLLSEAEELYNLQRANSVIGAVEFHKRYDITNLYIKRIINEKKLGKILYFTVDYSQKISIPLNTFKEWSFQTNIFQYLGVHYVDLIFFLTGFIPYRVSAYGTIGVLCKRKIKTYDSIHAHILWKNPENNEEEFLSQFSTNWIDPVCTSALSDQKYKVIGTKGRIECDQKNRGLEQVTEDAGIQSINPFFSDYLPDKNGELHFTGYGYDSIHVFLNDIIDLKQKIITLDMLDECRPSFKQSIVSTSVIEKVNESLNRNSEWRDINVNVRS